MKPTAEELARAIRKAAMYYSGGCGSAWLAVSEMCAQILDSPPQPATGIAAEIRAATTAREQNVVSRIQGARWADAFEAVERELRLVERDNENILKIVENSLDRIKELESRLAEKEAGKECDWEALGKAAQKAFHACIYSLRGSSPCLPWGQEGDSWRQAWRNAAQAVVEASRKGGQ